MDLRFLVLLLPFQISQARRLQISMADGANMSKASVFCWKDSQPRGAGRVPTSCAPGFDRVGLFCYKNCDPGFTRGALNCWQKCPSEVGWRNDGALCRKKEYGRSAGRSSESKCKQIAPNYGVSTCERSWFIWYPKCRPGYKPFGCCICRPDGLNCAALGFAGQFDLSCTKTVRGAGVPHLGSCSSTEDRNAGLCYPKCGDGYKGVGPVCWGQPPTNWVNCGMGAASSSAECTTAVMNQVVSVGKLAFTVGTGGAALLGSSSTESVSKFPELKAKYEKMKKAWENLKADPVARAEIDKVEAAFQVKGVKDGLEKSLTTAMEQTDDKVSGADVIRMAAELAAIVDKSGVSDTIAAYSHKKCSEI